MGPQRRFVTVAVMASVLGSIVGLVPAASAVAAKPRTAEETVELVPMVELWGDQEGIDWNDPRNTEVLNAAKKLRTVKVRVSADASPADRFKALDAEGTKAEVDWQRQLDNQMRSARDAKSQTIYGNCGWSSITLQDSGPSYEAYVKSAFSINKPGYAYRTNVHVWDTSALDPSAWDFPDTGNLYGATSYWDDFVFDVDERGASYGAKLDRGEVSTSSGTWCYTGVPQVDNVIIY